MRSFTNREKRSLMSLSCFFQGMILTLIAINSIHGWIYFCSVDLPLSLLTWGIIFTGITLVLILDIFYTISFATFFIDEKKPVKILFFAFGIVSGFFGKELTYLFLPITFFLIMCALYTLFQGEEEELEITSGSEERTADIFLSILLFLAMFIDNVFEYLWSKLKKIKNTFESLIYIK